MSEIGHVDSLVPRGKAVFHAVLPAIAYLLGPPIGVAVLGITALLMAASVLAGPRYSLLGRAFQKIRVFLKLGPGRREEAAPHRFAEAVGALFLAAAAVLHLLGSHGLADVLALIVVGLAVLNAAAGICVGCQMYLLAKKTQSRVAA